MKWIPLIVWPLLIIFSLRLPAAEHNNSGAKKEQNPHPAEEESPWPKKTPPLKLEETELGQALENSDLTAYREAMSDLKKKSFKEASKVLTATDKNGNNILHRIAQIEKSKDGFLAEAQFLAITLFHLGEGEILDELLNTGNRKNRTPKEIFKDAKDRIAREYFVEMENLIKLRKRAPGAETMPKPASFSDYMGWAEEIDSMLAKDKTSHSINKERFRVLVDREMFQKKGMLGAILLLNGSIFTSFGFQAGYTLPILLGASQMLMGGAVCYEAFKTSWLLEKNK